jgi:hypothetical protein
VGRSRREPRDAFPDVLYVEGGDSPDRHQRDGEPMEKQSTSTAPSGICFNWRQRSKIVMAAGQGMMPPVRPKRAICQVVMFWSAKRRRISLACALSWAS